MDVDESTAGHLAHRVGGEIEGEMASGGTAAMKYFFWTWMNCHCQINKLPMQAGATLCGLLW